MHRMISIDYVIVQKGAVVLALDDKSKTLVGRETLLCSKELCMDGIILPMDGLAYW